MKFLQRWWVIVALLAAFAMAVSFLSATMTVCFLSAQTEEPSAVNAPSSAKTELLNELRSDLLNNRAKMIDDRAETINWWLVVIAIVLTFFGIAIPIIALEFNL